MSEIIRGDFLAPRTRLRCSNPLFLALPFVNSPRRTTYFILDVETITYPSSPCVPYFSIEKRTKICQTNKFGQNKNQFISHLLFFFCFFFISTPIVFLHCSTNRNSINCNLLFINIKSYLTPRFSVLIEINISPISGCCFFFTLGLFKIMFNFLIDFRFVYHSFGYFW